jgi:hypothetical protein
MEQLQQSVRVPYSLPNINPKSDVSPNSPVPFLRGLSHIKTDRPSLQSTSHGKPGVDAGRDRNPNFVVKLQRKQPERIGVRQRSSTHPCPSLLL